MTTDPITQGRESIRHLFGSQLAALGIDCFTVYVKDLWNDHPEIYVPQEIDDHLWYREPMRSTPPPGHLSARGEEARNSQEPPCALNDQRYSGIQLFSVHTPEVNIPPPDQIKAMAARYSGKATLFKNFVEREEIKSSVMYMASTSVTHRFFERLTRDEKNRADWFRHATTSPKACEFLFFNFREHQDFNRPLRNS